MKKTDTQKSILKKISEIKSIYDFEDFYTECDDYPICDEFEAKLRELDIDSSNDVIYSFYHQNDDETFEALDFNDRDNKYEWVTMEFQDEPKIEYKGFVVEKKEEGFFFYNPITKETRQTSFCFYVDFRWSSPQIKGEVIRILVGDYTKLVKQLIKKIFEAKDSETIQEIEYLSAMFEGVKFNLRFDAEYGTALSNTTELYISEMIKYIFNEDYKKDELFKDNKGLGVFNIIPTYEIFKEEEELECSIFTIKKVIE